MAAGDFSTPAREVLEIVRISSSQPCLLKWHDQTRIGFRVVPTSDNKLKEKQTKTITLVVRLFKYSQATQTQPQKHHERWWKQLTPPPISCGGFLGHTLAQTTRGYRNILNQVTYPDKRQPSFRYNHATTGMTSTFSELQ